MDPSEVSATAGGGAPPPPPETTSTAPAAAPQLDSGPAASGTLNNLPLEKAKAESWSTKVYHGVLGALGGTQDTSYEVVPPSATSPGGVIKHQTASTPGTQWKRIIAGVVTGAAGGNAAPPGQGFGGGFAAVQGTRQANDNRQRKEANEDYDTQQRAVTSQAQNALLSHQISQSVFNLGRSQVEAAATDAERETNFEKIVVDGGAGSQDMGIFPDFASAMKAFKENPELHDHQAGGRIVTIPHIGADGKIDGIHAALVSPDWLTSKINRELPVTVRNYKNGKLEESTFTIPANTLTGDQYAKLVMGQSKEALDDHIKVATEKRLDSRTDAENDASRGAATKDRAEAGKAEAEGRKADAEAGIMNTTGELPSRASQSEKEEEKYGPGGARGFNQWHQQMVVPALQTETSYQIASKAYNEYQEAAAKGKTLPTGAQSMQMLSQHIATTFGTVKGARITKDMISAHLGARSVTDTLQVAVQRLVNGDALSKAQWDAFGELISNKRNEQWNQVLQDAVSESRPLDSIAFPADFRTKKGLGPGRTLQDASGAAQPGGQPAAQPAPGQAPKGATGQVQGSDGKPHWTDGKQDLGVVQ